MRAVLVFQDLAWAFYVLIFVIVARRAARRPTRANLEIALFFGDIFLIIAISTVPSLLGVTPPAGLALVTGALLLALPYLLLRLLVSFSEVAPRWLRFTEAGLVLAVVGLVATAGQPMLWLTLLLVAYFVVTALLAAGLFIREARRAGGVTRRRLEAVALGSALLGLEILCAGLAAADPTDNWNLLVNLLAVASGVSYFVGFATPAALRRVWQEPEIHRFLKRATELPRIPELTTLVDELERGVGAAFGAPGASIQLWDPARRVLRGRYHQRTSGALADPAGSAPAGQYAVRDGWWEQSPDLFVVGRVFQEQRAAFIEDAARVDPANAAVYEQYGARAVLAAPIIAAGRPRGVLTVFAPRSPIFADSDLELVQLLADQTAVILENHALIDEIARVRAREEAARLKEDFLSSAAHDLKSPLTGIIGHSQYLRRRLERVPTEQLAPADLDRIIAEARRLDGFIGELLDASRSERGQLVDLRETVDLARLAREVCSRDWPGKPSFVVEAGEPVVGQFDPVRLRQLVSHLVDNAVKFSPPRAEVGVRVTREGDDAHLTVRDQGIGIPPEDQPLLFERFHRGRNVDDRRYVGLGLGLFICRGIVEEHGGRIWVESRSSGAAPGSTFHVVLPLSGAAPAPTSGALLESTSFSAPPLASRPAFG
ncbi:MAG TPA: ATP-binding protein [Chloroflexota bacterium]|nr:ATP-binding protein [Chloroflexota bacterium]